MVASSSQQQPPLQKPERRSKRGFTTRVRELFLKQRRRVPEMLQMDMSECGAACLTMILNYYNYRVTIASVRERCGVGRDGLSALAIVRAEIGRASCRERV